MRIPEQPGITDALSQNRGELFPGELDIYGIYCSCLDYFNKDIGYFADNGGLTTNGYGFYVHKINLKTFEYLGYLEVPEYITGDSLYCTGIDIDQNFIWLKGDSDSSSPQICIIKINRATFTYDSTFSLGTSYKYTRGNQELPCIFKLAWGGTYLLVSAMEASQGPPTPYYSPWPEVLLQVNITTETIASTLNLTSYGNLSGIVYHRNGFYYIGATVLSTGKACVLTIDSSGSVFYGHQEFGLAPTNPASWAYPRWDVTTSVTFDGEFIYASNDAIYNDGDSTQYNAILVKIDFSPTSPYINIVDSITLEYTIFAEGYKQAIIIDNYLYIVYWGLVCETFPDPYASGTYAGIIIVNLNYFALDEHLYKVNLLPAADPSTDIGFFNSANLLNISYPSCDVATRKRRTLIWITT